MKSVFFLLNLALISASAATNALEVKSYDCNLIIFAAGVDTGSQEVSFSKPVQGGGHGGEEAEYTFGVHKILILADGKWRNLNWYINDKLIAGSVSAVRDVYTTPHTTILYNPENTDEQISLDCSPVTK